MNDTTKKLYTYLGFTAKSRTAKAGEQAALAHLKKNAVFLLVIAQNAQPKSIKRWTERALEYNVPYIMMDSQEEMGRAIGSSYKTIIAVTDKKLAEAMLSCYGGTLWEKSESTN